MFVGGAGGDRLALCGGGGGVGGGGYPRSTQKGTISVFKIPKSCQTVCSLILTCFLVCAN